MDAVQYVSPKKASQFFKVSETTLRTWANQGKIAFIKTSGGHRRYRIPLQDNSRYGVIYARVSSKKQKEDLKRQVSRLRKKYPHYRLVQDIGSGINVNRKGFKTILEQLFNGNIKEVVVTYPDRFSRFSFDLFEWIFQQFGSRLLAISNPPRQSDEQELAEDLIAITTVFTSKFYGRRSHIHKKNQVLS